MLASLDRVVLALTTPLAVIALLRITPGLAGHPFDAIEAFTGWALAPAWLSLVYALARRAHAVALLASPAALVHAMLVATLVTPVLKTSHPFLYRLPAGRLSCTLIFFILFREL